MVMTVLALVLANSPLSEAYAHFFHMYIEFNVGSWELKHSLHHWINDGLMAIFFFMIGLEIKREVTTGELADMKATILPILAAIGGMVFSALIYLSINAGGEGANGWGIPMATDIAFAISALVLLGKRVPSALVTFLVALAIVDDLGAVMVIALFYTDTINMVALGLAGVLVALAIPSKPKKAPVTFTDDTKELLSEYDKYPVATDHVMHEKQKAILLNIKDKIDAVGTPASRLEHALHLPVALIIIPLFALANVSIHRKI